MGKRVYPQMWAYQLEKNGNNPREVLADKYKDVLDARPDLQIASTLVDMAQLYIKGQMEKLAEEEDA